MPFPVWRNRFRIFFFFSGEMEEIKKSIWIPIESTRVGFNLIIFFSPKWLSPPFRNSVSSHSGADGGIDTIGWKCKWLWCWISDYPSSPPLASIPFNYGDVEGGKTSRKWRQCLTTLPLISLWRFSNRSADRYPNIIDAHLRKYDGDG